MAGSAGGLGSPPSGAGWWQLYGVARLCGIGFTMSLFIAGLAFASPEALGGAELAVLTASAAMGGAVLILSGRRRTR